MSAMKELLADANEALDAYREYDNYYDHGDYDHDETCDNLRWRFIEAAVQVLEQLTGRKVLDGSGCVEQ